MVNNLHIAILGCIELKLSTNNEVDCIHSLLPHQIECTLLRTSAIFVVLSSGQQPWQCCTLSPIPYTTKNLLGVSVLDAQNGLVHALRA